MTKGSGARGRRVPAGKAGGTGRRASAGTARGSGRATARRTTPGRPFEPQPVLPNRRERAAASASGALAAPGDPVRRQRWLMILAALVVAVFVVRLVYVQVVEGPALAQEAQAQRISQGTTAAHRGDITDANGVVLATSVDRYTVVADQEAIQSFEPRGTDTVDGKPLTEGGAVGMAKLLAPILGTSAPKLAAQLNGSSRYKVLARNVVPEVQRAIADLNLGAWIRTDQTTERAYPAGTVAGNLVGFVGADSDGTLAGKGGIEKVYNTDLAGKPGSYEYERGLGGQLIPSGLNRQVAAVAGDNVRLTVVHDIQWKAQDAIDEAVKTTGAEYGIVVVEDVRTGAILTLADSGTVNPNDRTTDAVARPSRAVSNVFDPGSTAKVITMAELIEGKYATPTSQYTVGYRYTTPNGQTFSDSHEHGTERLTLTGILAESSNSGTVQAGSKVPKQVRYDYLHKFGFGKSTGLGLPGESAGILRPANSWDGRTQYAVLFGQGLSVNAVQAASVFSTIANGGVRETPHIVAGTTDSTGKYTATTLPTGTRIVSAPTANTVLRMMEAVVNGGDGGTGAKAAVPGYLIAGKTGTAQAAGSNGKLTGIMASFVGVAPADNPRYTVAVFLKDPKTSIYGGDVAAPVFSQVMGFTLERMAVAPSSRSYNSYPTTW